MTHSLFYQTVCLSLIAKDLLIYSNKGKRAVSRYLKLKKKKGAWIKRDSMRAEEADLKERLISLPSDFSHVTHMGPGDGKMILKDLPEVCSSERTFEPNT